MNIASMKIRTKLTLLGVCIAAVAVGTITALCLTIFHQDLMQQVNSAQDRRIKVFWEFLNDKGTPLRIENNRLMAGNYVLNENYELPDKIKSIWGGAATIFMGNTRVSTNVMKPEGGRAIGTKLEGTAYDAVFKEGKAYRGEAVILGEQYFTAYDPIKNAKGEVIGALFTGVKRSDYFVSFNKLMLIIVVIAVALFGVVGFLTYGFTKKMFAPLDVVAKAAHQLSEGDLNVKVEAQGENEIGAIAKSFSVMIANVRSIVSQINTTTLTLATSSVQLSTTADELHKGSQELSAQTDQVVTAMTEVSQTIMDVAKNASSAAEAAKNSVDTAAKGKSVVETTAQGMGRIAETVNSAATGIEELGRNSAQIGEIVAVINGIADQTNLLALNAAIEAARAGEQGRGFAVVADEVRKLAERTGQATHDIANRITGIQTATKESVDAMRRGGGEVSAGVDLTKEASASLGSIVDASSLAMDMVQRIAAATEEQSAASEQVTQSMENISTITKRTATSTEHIRASSAELAQHSSELKSVTAWFKM